MTAKGGFPGACEKPVGFDEPISLTSDESSGVDSKVRKPSVFCTLRSKRIASESL